MRICMHKPVQKKDIATHIFTVGFFFFCFWFGRTVPLNKSNHGDIRKEQDGRHLNVGAKGEGKRFLFDLLWAKLFPR